MKTLVCGLAWLCVTFSAHAHKASDSYLTLDVSESGIAARWDIALRDLEFALGMDADGDGQITWRELRTQHANIAAYAFAHLQLRNNNHECTKSISDQRVEQHSDGGYAVLLFDANCAGTPDTLSLDYTLFFDIDRGHRGLLRVQRGAEVQSAVLGPEDHARALAYAPRGQLNVAWDYLREGTTHVLSGYDHLLFLLSLLFTAVLIRAHGAWQPASSLRGSVLDVVKVVTAFTLAHSATLTLAALNIVQLPSRWVESAIALSVILAAVNNVIPFLDRKRWLMAFAFGLLHGFGFANALTELGLNSTHLATALFSFNLGVELGQLFVVALFVPAAYALRATWGYQFLVVRFGSFAVIGLALVWLIERSAEIRIFPGTE